MCEPRLNHGALVARAALMLALAVVLVPAGCAPRPAEPPPGPRPWERLPSLPVRGGVAGTFAGASGGALIVAGGANFPDGPPWERGAKRWHDSVFVLESPDGEWQTQYALPRPTAYGVSAIAPGDDGGVVCAGGGDATRHFRDVLLLSWRSHLLLSSSLSDLPGPCAFMAGAVVGDTLYVAGGLASPGAAQCLRTFWSLDLRDRESAWRVLEPCPGPERMLAVAGSTGGSFYLFGGVRLVPGASADDKPTREYLRDAWRYTPGRGWTRIADLPHPVAAAPSPAPRADDGRLLVISGDDGANVNFRPESQHPGFPPGILAYDPRTDTWADGGDAPISRATAPTAEWNGRTVIPSGEPRPGYRSAEVWVVGTPAR